MSQPTSDFDNTRILDIVNDKIKGEFSVMFNIYLYPNTVNRMDDINNLKHNYRSSVDLLTFRLPRFGRAYFTLRKLVFKMPYIND